MTLTLPDLYLVVLVVVSGSGKSTFARKHFRPTESLSSDACRAMVSDNENNQATTKDAPALNHFLPRREALRRVHECIFGVLALESEPVDPRL